MKKLFDAYNKFRYERGLSGSALKVIALVLMLTDHTAAMLLTASSLYQPMRIAGRLAFPIFAFLIAEGMAYTRNIWIYALRLAVFAVVAEIPYDLCLHGKVFYFGDSSVFVTLLIPVVTEAVMRRFQGKRLYWLAGTAAAALGMGAALVLGPDYGWKGVLLVAIFYYLRDFHPLGILAAGAFMLIAWHGLKIQPFAVLSLPLLIFYSGRRGFIDTRIKGLAAYAFYPLHMFLLFAVKLAVVYIGNFGK